MRPFSRPGCTFSFRQVPESLVPCENLCEKILQKYAKIGENCLVRRQITIAAGFLHLESISYPDLEVLKSTGHLSGRKQLLVSAAASDTGPYQCKMICMKKEASSGSLPPVVSMMQATHARE